MFQQARTLLTQTVLAALVATLAPPGAPAVLASDDGAPRSSIAAGLAEHEVRAEIAHGCTKSSAEILATVQGLQHRQEFMTVRHRGDFDAKLPENSRSAFEESYLRCRGAIETDLRRTADGTLVMFHDTHVGKMLEPGYDPLTGTGPNAALSSLTWEQLQTKTLVNIERKPQAGEKVLSLDEFLDHYRRVGGQSLLFVEIKQSTDDKQEAQDEIMDAVEQVAAFDRAYPDLKIFDRVVFKFRISAFPTFGQWNARVGQIPGLPRVPLTQVQVSRQMAHSLRADQTIPGTGDVRVENAVQSWAGANATTHGVLSVEVTMKDSSGYTAVHARGDDASLSLPFRGVGYSSPQPGAAGKPGTMARASSIVREAGKPLGQFVPVPDWVLFRSPGTFSWDDPLPNIDQQHRSAPVTPRDGFFNNTSACCYALRDRVDPRSTSDQDPEQNDQRLLLPWLEDIGATILTADDTDSVDAYFTGRGKKLDTGDNKVSPNRPDPAMNSVIFPGAEQLPSLMKLVTAEVVPRGSDLNWFVHGDMTLSEDVRSARDRSSPHRSTDGPKPLMAVAGASTLTIRAGWSWLEDPWTLHDETTASWPLPEHLEDGRHTWPMQLGRTQVDVRVTVSRAWATAQDIEVVMREVQRKAVWGSVCGLTAAEKARPSSCDPNTKDGAVLASIRSTAPQVIAPGGALKMHQTTFSGARPLAVSTELWGRGWDDQLVSHATVTIDQPAWGQVLSREAPGDYGLAVVQYVLRADSFRDPL